MTFSELKLYFKKNLGIVRLADIARELNVTPQAINNWKIRDQVPPKIILLIKQKYFIKEQNINPVQNEVLFDNNREKNRNLDFYFGKKNQQDPIITFWNIIGLIKKSLNLVFLFSAISFLASLFFIFFLTSPTYTTSATIVPASNESSASKMVGIAAQLGISVPNSQGGQIMILPQILKSRTLAKKMLFKKFDTFKFGSRQDLLKILTKKDSSEVGIDTLIIKGIRSFVDAVTIKNDLKTSIITISVKAIEPKLAVEITNSLIEELNTHQKTFNTQQIIKKRIFIEERIEDIHIDLIKAEEKLKSFRIENRKYADSPALLLEFERNLRETELQKQLYITLKKELEITQINEVEESDVLHILDEPELPLNKSSPRTKLIVFSSIIIGSLLGFLISVIKEFFINQNKIKNIL